MTNPKLFRAWLLALLAFLLLPPRVFSQASLNVTNYGAISDCVSLTANTTSNSASVTVSTSLTSARIGEVIEIFGAGTNTDTTYTNHTDLIGLITGVSGTTVTVSNLPRATLTGAYCLIGTNNAAAFQAAEVAGAGNAIINIPAGNFLLVPPQMFGAASYASFYLTAVFIHSGGEWWHGAGMTNTVLTGCGAWSLMSGSCQRGVIFDTTNNLSNLNALVFSDMTWDGGVASGFTANHSYPGSPINGAGWDGTHHSFGDQAGPFASSETFSNLVIRNWLGEAVISTSTAQNGSILLTNCDFINDNVSALNFSSSKIVDSCLFSNVWEVEEFYRAYNTNSPSWIRNCTAYLPNNANGIALNGGTATNQPYYISNNIIWVNGGEGILTAPAANVLIQNNTIYGTNGAVGIMIGSGGYEGYFWNSNFFIAGNVFSNIAYPVMPVGSAPNAVQNVLVSNNVAYNDTIFGYPYSNSQTTNVVYTKNSGSYLLSIANGGQWQFDAGDNHWRGYPAPYSGGIVEYGTTNTGYLGSSCWVLSGAAGSTWTNDDMTPQGLLGTNSVFTLTNSTGTTVYYVLSLTNPVTKVTIPAGQQLQVYWSGTTFSQNPITNNPPASGAPMLLPFRLF